MFTIYFVDYTVIARYAKIIGACMIILGGYSLVSGTPMRGMRYYIRLAGIEFNFAAFMTLYVPVYGAILYSYRDGGIGAFVKSIIWLIIPAGGSNMILSYALIGIVLSIYRYKDVYPGRVSVSGKRRLRLIRKNVSEVNE